MSKPSPAALAMAWFCSAVVRLLLAEAEAEELVM